MAERVVTKVRPKRNLQSFPELILQKRVAAYARVSSDSEEQLNSVEAQKDYFEKLIKEKPEWIFAGVYMLMRAFLVQHLTRELPSIK